MAIWSRFGLSGPAAGVAVVVVLLIVGGVVLVTQTRDAEAPEPVAQGGPAAAPREVAAVDTAPEQVAQPETPPAPDTDNAAPSASIEAPAFDVVQVRPDGGGVVAGRAAPGQSVTLMLDGEELAQATADASGKFGLVLDFPSSDAPRALSMVSEQPDGTSVLSEGTVLISPTRAAETPAAADEVPAVAETEQPEVDAPAVVLADDAGVTLLQPAPQPEAPTTRDNAPVTANVVIDTITYDAEGEVALAGRGASNGFVRVYLDGKPVKTTRIAENGAWDAPLPDVDAGVYRLRIDEVDADGKVTSRVETPFQREAPEIALANPRTATAVTVQPGFTLWAIARDRFGAGEQYVRVYEANRDLIRDPDLIYPGQVFALPDG
ncbi:LysM peptidoglycan-binding domain-containing protein [Litoreibacter arenae]|uniref:LysM domain protein n=1 Tax=Litoreibacter arenae DSM 19593 TaxID=1123360 RepID=S9RMC9_9RHOB|nr:LysM peptidoglycan-binding domain-containing protein [Litoreibacter arenae]EPX79265.1 lysM domain protein [Litoreibacter arenae DSM 19593]